MKKTIKSTRVIAIALFTLFAVSIAATSANAGGSPVTPFELKRIGTLRDQPLLQLNFNSNTDENEFTLIVRDDAGNALYRENIKAGITSKKFLVNTEEIGDDSIYFEITDRKNNKTVVYEVNNNRRFTEETVINKVK